MIVGHMRSVIRRVVFMSGFCAIATCYAIASGEMPPRDGAPLLPPLVLSLRGALDAAIDNNPTVQLYKERIDAVYLPD